MVYGRRAALGAALATTIAALWADVLVQFVYMLFVRDRPEEVLGSQALLVDGGHWAHIASFPSGHMVVTTAIVVAAIAAVPWLRVPLWTYCGLIALTRITFGAHFPLDVVAGIAFGYPVGLFAWELVSALRSREAAATGTRATCGGLRVDEVAPARDHRDGLGGDVLDLRLDARELLVRQHRRALERQLALELEP